MKYKFDCEKVINKLEKDLKYFLNKVNSENVVLGISGGKDSTFVAYFTAKVLGPKHVYGVMLPNDVQKDISDSRKVIEYTKINSIEINIGDAYHSIIDGVENNTINVSEQTKINLPPRLRMSALYAIAQSVNGIVLCNSNLSEIMIGYSTLFGDSVGSYALLKDLTVSEIIELGKYIGIPKDLIEKIPSDGLSGKSDEDKLGFKYEDLDKYIRENKGTTKFKKTINERFKVNKFKSEIINVPYPKLNLPNFIYEN